MEENYEKIHSFVVCHSNNFIYFGDNKNAPYGNKSKRELLSLAISDA